MKRRILIIDDRNDLAGSLRAAFESSGHDVKVIDNRQEAVEESDLDSYDLVITDLDVDHSQLTKDQNGSSPGGSCLPRNPESAHSKHVKAFKICATNFRRDDFNEEELRDLIDQVLNYKIDFVDTKDYIRQIHEKVEFELPSAISPMYAILEYLTKRVEKMGVIDSKESNLFVALDEAIANAVKHGNKFDTHKLVRVSAELSVKEACFTVEDEGEGFDVNAIPDPLDPQNLFKTSGRGVLFICNIMDEVEYNERGNRLRMVKRPAGSCELPKIEEHTS